MRKKYLVSCFCPLFIFGLVSCVTETPYASMQGWVMRQNSTPRYFAVYDIFFLPPSLFTGSEEKSPEWTRRKETERIYNYVFYQLSEQFGNKVRFFVPHIQALPRSEAQKYLTDPPEEFRKTSFEPVINHALNAFTYYLENYHVPGRPFIIAGQGQGALAAYEMMKRCPRITPENGFVAACLTGFPGLRADRIIKDFGKRGIRPARAMKDTGVIFGWCIQGHSEPERIAPDSTRYVINPLSWRTDTGEVSAESNLRSVLYNEFDPNPLERRLEAKNLCGAVIDNAGGVLRILPVSGQEKARRFMDGQQFRYNDMGLFLQSLQNNFKNRVDQYLHENHWRLRQRNDPVK